VGQTLREGGSKAVPVLAQLLADERSHIRSLALMFLEVNQEDISASASALSDYLRGPDSYEFAKAMAILKRINETTARDVLLRCMHPDSDPEKRDIAIATASLFGPEDADVLANLESCMDDPELAIRVASAQKMLEFKHRHARLPEVFLESLQVKGRALSIPWWEATSVYHDEIVPALMERLRSPVPAIHDNAAQAFMVASLTPVDVPLLIKELKNESADIRRSAVSHLGSFARQSQPAVKALIEVVQSDANDGVRQTAVSCLGLLGPAAGVAVPALTSLVRQENSPNRLNVV
jgi:HEAT repeat protein